MTHLFAQRLGGVSLAEWEYAYRYRDFVALGEPEPDAAGFDAERIALIRDAIRTVFYAQRERLRRRPGRRA